MAKIQRLNENMCLVENSDLSLLYLELDFFHISYGNYSNDEYHMGCKYFYNNSGLVLISFALVKTIYTSAK